MYSYPNVPRCHHIKTNGTRCGSPALRHQTLCFFHQRWQQQRIVVPRSYPGYETSIELPVLEDANSIQVALTQVMRLILLQKLSTKEGGLLLYALQIASANLKRTRFEPDEKSVVIDPAALATAGVGVDSWKPADFPEPLPDDPTPEAAFTPNPSQPVFYDGKKPAPTPDGAVIPELKAEAEDPHDGWPTSWPSLHFATEQGCPAPCAFCKRVWAPSQKSGSAQLKSRRIENRLHSLHPLLLKSHLLQPHGAEEPASPPALHDEVPARLCAGDVVCPVTQRHLDLVCAGDPAGH